MVADRPSLNFASVQITLVAVVAAIGGLGLKSAFVSWGFAPLVVVAALGAAITSVLVFQREVPFPLSVAVSLLSLLLVGTILTYGFPWMIASFGTDLVVSWRRILTIAAPVDPQSSLVAVPIVATWVGTMVGCELALRTERIVLPVIGPALTIAGAILFGLSESGLSLWVGLTAFVLSLMLIGLRSRSHWIWTNQRGVSTHRPRLLMASGVVAISMVMAPFLSGWLFGFDDSERFTFRQQVDPPFDLTRLSSPLAELKGSLPTADMTAEGDRGEVAFTISGDPVSRVRLAVLDDYDGNVWLINRNAAGADFIRAGTQFPPLDSINQGQPVRNAFEIVGLSESWLPTAGTAVGLEITSEVLIGGVAPVELIRLDRVTGNLIIRPRIRTVPGLSYEVESVPPIEASLAEESLVDASVLTSARNVQLTSEVPAQISSLARDTTKSVDSPFEKVRAVEALLADQVYDVESRPGHVMVQLATIADRDPMVGFDEQYAALMATMLRSEGIPARVVVGYVPANGEFAELEIGGSVEIYMTDIEAWVEVPFEGHGWVAFEAGPPDTQTEDVDEGTSEAQAESVSANPPPPTTSTTTTTIPEAEEEEEEQDETLDNGGGVPTVVVAAGLALAAPLALFGVFAALVIIVKARRRSKRRSATSPAMQIIGAYEELVDSSVDAGRKITGSGTARSTIAELADEEFDPQARSGSLVLLVEDAAFAPTEPTVEQVALAWEHSDELTDRLGAEVPLVGRVRAKLSLQSLWAGRKERV